MNKNLIFKIISLVIGIALGVNEVCSLLDNKDSNHTHPFNLEAITQNIVCAINNEAKADN
ncbi:hypothetical protein YTPLAS21_19550 [Candidatus Nitrosocosmicus sp.]|nr:hypothetical protein YTPLAS21_19550 [Candidatus Nitrosocosmicus sp.]